MFGKRSALKEIIDLGPSHYTVTEYNVCLQKLFMVNKFFGFFYSTRQLLNAFITSKSLLDIGCGSGLFIINLSRYFPQIKMVGIDISAGAISLANTQLIKYPTDNVTFQLQLEPNLKQQPNYDIILATLVCHHLNDEELIQFLKESYAHCNRAIILNDLHRHPIAYWFYKVFSPLLFRNKIISHDGAISILRSFTRKDWLAVLNKAGIKHYQVRWCFPFRWRILIWKK